MAYLLYILVNYTHNGGHGDDWGLKVYGTSSLSYYKQHTGTSELYSAMRHLCHSLKLGCLYRSEYCVSIVKLNIVLSQLYAQISALSDTGSSHTHSLNALL